MIIDNEMINDDGMINDDVIINIELAQVYDIIDITINGMTCASCSASIEDSVGKLNGIKSIRVNLITGKGLVEYNIGKINLREILFRIRNLGFDAFLTKDDSKEIKVLEKLEQERKILRTRVIILSILGVLAMVGMILMICDVEEYKKDVYPGISFSSIYMFILSTPVQFVIGYKFYKNVWKQLRYNTNFNMETLIILSTSLAYILSIWMVYLNLLIGQSRHHTFFETSVFIFTFVYVGKFLELKGKIWAARIMNNMVSNEVRDVTLVKDLDNLSITEEIDENLICIGDIIKVKPNEKIPCDGKIVLYNTFVDESMLTGESESVSKDIGAKVYAGTINISNTVYIKTLETGANTLINRMVSLVENAQSNKTSFQSTTDFICKWFVYVVIGLAVVDFIVWLIIGRIGLVNIPDGFTFVTFALYSSISVIVVACPCALGLATPMVIMVGSGVAMNKGILIKNGADTIEKMSKIKAIVFDKTGTLTYGKMNVVDYILLDDNIDLLSYTKTLANISNHPISKCLMEYTHKYKTYISSNEKVYNGKGVECYINGDQHKLGSLNWLNKEEYSDSMISILNRWNQQGYSIVVQSINHTIVAMFAISDIIRPESRDVVNNFKEMGIDVWMVSGDNEFNAKKVSKSVGIDETQVLSNVLPEAKSEIIEAIQSSGCANIKRRWWSRDGYIKMSKKIVAMVGDGGNDSIALSQADIGIAMRHGSDLALSSASVVLMKSDIQDVLYLKKLSDKVMKRIYINLGWAMGYNIIGIPLAAGVFYPWNISPMCAGLMMSLSSLFVVGNSLRPF
jgi:heavy metal translocating P-type ATPase